MSLERLRWVHLLYAAAIVLSWHYSVMGQTTPSRQFEPLKRSEMLRAQELLKWLINNRTENNTKTFNAGFIRLAFHDCVGGCDGCLNLRNPSNAGLGFYKEPLDLMYQEFIFPTMSRADWYALAGLTAVEYAATLTPCTGRICVPPMTFKWGRKDCVNEDGLFRQFPGPNNDPRDTIRRTFRMNLLEITALMGAHTLGKNHGTGATWVKNETRFDNQYYKDMIDSSLQWRKGVRQGSASNTWSHGSTGNNLMLDSDFFMAFNVGTRFGDCNNNPIESCAKSETFGSVQRMAEDNDYWLRHFGTAFTVMLNNGNFGKLKDVEWDTFDETYTGDIFARRNTAGTTISASSTTRPASTPAPTPAPTPSTTPTTTPATTTPAPTPTTTPAPTPSTTPTTTPTTTTRSTTPTTITKTSSRNTGSISLNTTVSASAPTGVTTGIISTTTNSSSVSSSSDLSTRSLIINNGQTTTMMSSRTEAETLHDTGDVSPNITSSAQTVSAATTALGSSTNGTSVSHIASSTTAIQTVVDQSNSSSTVKAEVASSSSDASRASLSTTVTTKLLTHTSSLAPPLQVTVATNGSNGNAADSRIGYQFENESFNTGIQDRLRDARQRLRSRSGRRGRQTTTITSANSTNALPLP